jgi:hypothetical protein
MSEVKPQNDSDGVTPAGEPSKAEVKRLAARRRFLKRGAAAGSGAVVLTLYHTKGYAGGKKVVLSSAMACMSLGGTPGKKPVKVQDSVVPYVYDAKGNKKKNMVEVTECELPLKK